MLARVAAMSKSGRKLPTRRAVIFVYDGVQVLDVAGTAQALTTANEEGAAPQYDLRLCALMAGTGTTAAGVPVPVPDVPTRSRTFNDFISAGAGRPSLH